MSSSANVSSMTRWMVMLSSARSNLYGISDLLHAGADVRPDEFDDVLHRRAGEEDPLHPGVLQFRNIHVRNDAPDDYEHVVQSLLPEQLHDLRADVHVRTRQDREADHVRILLERSRDDHLGRL